MLALEETVMQIDEELRKYDENGLFADISFFRQLPEMEVSKGWDVISRSQVLLEKQDRYIFPSKDGNFYDVTSLVEKKSNSATNVTEVA